MCQVIYIVHDRADDAVGIVGRIRRHPQIHQVSALDNGGAGLRVERTHSQILTNLFPQKAAVKDVGETACHGRSSGKVAVGIIARGPRSDNEGRFRGIRALKIRMNAHVYDQADRDSSQQDHPKIAQYVAQYAVRVDSVQCGGEISIFVHPYPSTTTYKIVVPSSSLLPSLSKRLN